jgi:NAD(P)-dependent dehydrogenase (short-subunit alcohol dehydrogenase family)
MASVTFSFTDEVAVVTGAASGIGRAVAKGFVKAGAKVALIDRDQKELAAAGREFGANAIPLRCDVTDVNEVSQAFEEIRKRLGDVSILVNSAGMSARIPAEQYGLADFDRLMTLNVRALFSLMQLCAKDWIARNRHGAIVNLASIFGIIADPLSAPYAASKGAVIQLTRTCAVEWAEHGIRVNAVAPGYTYTAMTSKTLESSAGKKILTQVPMQRAATVEEIANAVLFLASPAATFVTGHTLVVDGGRTAI